MNAPENVKLDVLINKIDKLDDKTNLIYQGLYGVPSTDDYGLLGKVNDNCDKIDNINSRLTRVEVKSGIIAGLVSAAAAVGSWFANKGG